MGWWVGFGCGWAKLNVLQKLLLVCRLAALLILRRVGILSVILLFVYCRSCRFFRVSANVLQLGVRFFFFKKTDAKVLLAPVLF